LESFSSIFPPFLHLGGVDEVKRRICLANGMNYPLLFRNKDEIIFGQQKFVFVLQAQKGDRKTICLSYSKWS
jgi:hypothetical protein